MAVPSNKRDDALLRNLVPLNTLSDEQLGTLLGRIVVEKAKKGAYLFREGDSDHHNVYLLSGTVALLSGQKEMDLVSSGTQTARFALAHQLPRKHSARAKSTVSFVRIDSRMLSDMLARSETESYEVNEAGSAGTGDWMSLLLQLPVFQQIPPANLQRVMMRMSQFSVSAGETIIQQGDEGDYFYLISRGVCQVTRQAEEDLPPVELARLKAGQGFGEEALISDQPRSSTVIMVTDGELVRLSKQDFVELVKQPLSRNIDYAEACKLIEGKSLWVDVRTPEEYEKGHLPEAINMPYFSLRFQASSLANDRSYLVYGSEIGQSAAAAYLLVEHDYEVFVISHDWSELSELAGLNPSDQAEETGNVIDFNRETTGSQEENRFSTDQGSGEVVSELQKQLQDTRTSYEKKLSQYQSEQKLLKQAFVLAKRKLELYEKGSGGDKEGLTNEVERLQAALSESEELQQKNNEDYLEKEQSLKQKIVGLEERLDQLRDELQDREDKIQDAAQKRLQLENDIEQARDEYQRSQDDVQAELASVKERYEEAKKLQDELKETQASVLTLQQTLIQETEERKRVQDAKLALVNAQEKLQAELFQRVDELDQERKATSHLQARLQSLEDQRSSIQRELESLRQAGTEADAEHQGLLGNLRAELDQARETITELSQIRQQLQSDRDSTEARLKTALKETEGRVEQLKTENQNLSDRITELESHLGEGESTIAELKQERDSLSEQLEQAQGLYTELQAQSVDAETQHQADLEALRKELRLSQEETASQKDSLNNTRTELNKLEEQRLDLLAQLEQEQRNSGFLKRSLETAEDAIEISESSYNEQAEELNSMKVQMDDLQAQFDTVQVEKVELIQALNAANQDQFKNEQHTQEVEREFRDSIVKLERELQTACVELERLKSEKAENENSHRIELDRLQTARNVAEERLVELQDKVRDEQEAHDNDTLEQQKLIEQLQDELKVIKAEQARLSQLENTERKSDEALETASREITQLKKTIEDLREVQLEMETQFTKDSEEEIEKLKAELIQEASRRRELEERARQADVLRRERDVQEAAVEMLGEDLERLGNENRLLLDEKKALEEKLSAMPSPSDVSVEASQSRMDEMHQKQETLEQERDAAKAETARLDGEVRELRGVIQTYTEQIQNLQSLGGDEELAALRSELAMVRRQSAEDLANLREQLAEPQSEDSVRDIGEAATLQALRQEVDSIRHALHDKERSLSQSQAQCRNLEDLIEDRDKEVDQLKQKLELLIRKTGGFGDFAETVVTESITSQILPEDSQQITDVLHDLEKRGQSPMDSDNKANKLGRLFRRK